MLKRLIEAARDEEGASMVEYGLLLALVAVVAMVALTPLGTSVRDTFQNVADAVTGAGAGG